MEVFGLLSLVRGVGVLGEGGMRVGVLEGTGTWTGAEVGVGGDAAKGGGDGGGGIV